ncbi:hypothetical protein LTR37_009364 [Vermiconidia calcicola]|uniref:Uncharacterized protein n=1 Tax=Vermiconidia calcicola TaxID=1690605 RepID=A0ACC3N874_9PEZI|nr:hypothetical protein LTR37_009364 [Vermiconidia calcicola]
MPLTITVLPASTQAGKETIRFLLQDESQPKIKAIYRDPAKAPSEFTSNANFTAVQGDVSGAGDSELDFGDLDAVFYIPPPTYDGRDTDDFARACADRVKAALRKASSSVKRLLVFSASGAQYEKDIGILSLNHIADTILEDSAPEVVIARTGFFMENWASAFETLEGDKPYFESLFTPLDYKIAMISTVDIGKVMARFLLQTGQPLPSSPYIFDLHGPRSYSANDVRGALETATGKKDIEIKAIEPDKLFEYYNSKVPEKYAKGLEEMTVAMLPGGRVAGDMERPENVVRGEIELVDVLRKFASGEVTKAVSGAF